MHYYKKDFWLSVLSGLITGAIAWQVLSFLSGAETNFGGFSHKWLVVAIPILWVVGIRTGFFMGKWFDFLPQFAKFVAIGFTNFGVDLGVLNILIAQTGHVEGWQYALFKAIAFLVAVTHSFFWNKYWTFEAGKSRGGGGEFWKFLAVNLAAAGVNVSIATFVATKVNPVLEFTPAVWANMAAVVGSASALTLSFVGLRFLVFKKTLTSVQ